MNTTPAPAEGKKTYFPGAPTLTIVFLVLVVAGFYFYVDHPEWSWGRIGAVIALGTVVLLLFRDWLEKYGDEYSSLEESGKAPKLIARFLAAAVTSIGSALLILSAVYQLRGNPVLEITAPPKDIVFQAAGVKEKEIDGEKLVGYLKSSHVSLQKIDDEVGVLWYPDLLIVNCGKEHSDEKCLCPDTYERVRHSGKWDLNAGATGDGITLCYKKVLYRQKAN
jgi:hypothetical protein